MFGSIMTIHLGDVWGTPFATEWSSEHAKKIAEAFQDRTKEWADWRQEIMLLAEELLDAAEADDQDWFNDAWDRMYDIADADRVTILLW